jgi:hypothetical protein
MLHNLSGVLHYMTKQLFWLPYASVLDMTHLQEDSQVRKLGGSFFVWIMPMSCLLESKNEAYFMNPINLIG